MMKNQFIDYCGPENMKEVESILGSFLTKVPPEAEQKSFLITIQEEEFLFGPLFRPLANLCRAGPWTAPGKHKLSTFSS